MALGHALSDAGSEAELDGFLAELLFL